MKTYENLVELPPQRLSRIFYFTQSLEKCYNRSQYPINFFRHFCSWMHRLSTVPAAWRTDTGTVTIARPITRSAKSRGRSIEWRRHICGQKRPQGAEIDFHPYDKFEGSPLGSQGRVSDYDNFILLGAPLYWPNRLFVNLKTVTDRPYVSTDH